MYENGGVGLKKKERKKKKEERRTKKKKQNVGVGLKKERKKKKEEEEKKTLEWVWRRKKNKEEDEEKKKPWSGSKEERKKKEKISLVMWQCTSERAHWDSLFTGLPLSHGSWVLKTVEMCFHFPSSSLIFLSHWITKHESWSPNKMSSVGPISFGSWVMKTGSYHLKLTTSKHALSHYIFFLIFFFMYAVQCLWVELQFLYSFTLFFLYLFFFSIFMCQIVHIFFFLSIMDINVK